MVMTHLLVPVRAESVPYDISVLGGHSAGVRDDDEGLTPLSDLKAINLRGERRKLTYIRDSGPFSVGVGDALGEEIVSDEQVPKVACG